MNNKLKAFNGIASIVLFAIFIFNGDLKCGIAAIWSLIVFKSKD